MEIALIEPEIPGNTGSIGRVCVGTNTRLHLVGRLGFDIDHKAVRRAGLDYWRYVDLNVEANVDAWLQSVSTQRLLFFSSKGRIRYDQIGYAANDILVFGSESKGLPETIYQQRQKDLIYLPILPSIRSLNLANAATVVLYEAMRQQGFSAIKNSTGQDGQV